MRFAERTRIRSSGHATAERAPHSPSATRALLRLEHLGDVAWLVAGSRTLDDVFEAAMVTVAGVVPVDGAIMIEQDAGRRGISIWPAHGAGPGSEAMEHAEAALASLGGGAPNGNGRQGAFVVLPLGAAGRPGFGVLQLEGDIVDAQDLLFVNAVAGQFAGALDRDRAWRQEEAQRLRCEELELVLRSR